MKNKRTSSFLIYVPYWIGVLAGLYLTVVAAWADMEAAFYGFRRLADSGLRGFSCPVLMTRDETRSISLKVSNPLDVPLRPVVRAEISTSLLPEEFLEQLELAPGETKRLEWTVGPENIDLERFIFAKALVYSVYPLPNQEATCGIFIVDLPGSGRTIFAFLVLLTLGGLGWGMYGMRRADAADVWTERYNRPMMFLAVVVGMGVAVSAMGGWMPSILLLAVAVLTIVILLGAFVMRERRSE
ncbi:MAG: hypothetical protein ACOYYI_04350 [Chloroflexota bacterium]